MNFDEMLESFKKLSEDDKREAINELARKATVKARECGFLGENESIPGIEEPTTQQSDPRTAPEIETG